MAYGIAAVLGVPFISSGLVYRLVTLTALENSVDITSQEMLLAMLQQHELQFEARVSGNAVFLDGAAVTSACHSSQVDAAVSSVAQHPQIRAWVNAKIRQLEPPFVAEGRDMGSTVFPDANVKIFLTASSLVRAQRRVGERRQSLSEVQASIEARDAMDAKNSQPAPDAVLLDSSLHSLEETVQQALQIIRQQLGEQPA